jgi:zinc transport system substrate-binding protein
LRQLFLYLPFLLTLCYPQMVSSQVIVSIPPQQDFITQIAGDKIQVEVMLTPGDSPETFSPTPRQLAVWSTASIYIQMGVPFERHWTRPLQELNPDIKIVQCCQQFKDVLVNFHQDDMHYWTDPLFVEHYLSLIVETMVALQPEKRELISENFKNYQGSLRQLDKYIRNRLVNRQINSFIISHSALDAFADRYDLKQLSLEQSGREPGPKKILTIVETAKRLKINNIFVVRQYHTRTIDSLASQMEAQLVTVNPLAKDYLANMYEITDKLANALGNKP